MQLNDKKAEGEHRAGNCESNNCKAVKAICGNAQEGKKDAKFESKNSTDVTKVHRLGRA